MYLPRKDERLSQPGWLTYSGRFTRISGHPSAAGRAQDSESLLYGVGYVQQMAVKERRSTTVPGNQVLHVFSRFGFSLNGITECERTAKITLLWHTPNTESCLQLRSLAPYQRSRDCPCPQSVFLRLDRSSRQHVM